MCIFAPMTVTLDLLRCASDPIAYRDFHWTISLAAGWMHGSFFLFIFRIRITKQQQYAYGIWCQTTQQTSIISKSCNSTKNKPCLDKTQSRVKNYRHVTFIVVYLSLPMNLYGTKFGIMGEHFPYFVSRCYFVWLPMYAYCERVCVCVLVNLRWQYFRDKLCAV